MMRYSRPVDFEWVGVFGMFGCANRGEGKGKEVCSGGQPHVPHDRRKCYKSERVVGVGACVRKTEGKGNERNGNGNR